jgi:hypothetical protein
MVDEDYDNYLTHTNRKLHNDVDFIFCVVLLIICLVATGVLTLTGN